MSIAQGRQVQKPGIHKIKPVPAALSYFEITPSPNLIMNEVTKNQLGLCSFLQRYFNTKCKGFWIVSGLVLAISVSFVLIPNDMFTLAINAIKWRSSLFFLFSSFDLAASVHRKVRKSHHTIHNPWPSLQLIVSAFSWIGFCAGIAAFIFQTFTPLAAYVPFLNFAMGCAFAISEIFNLCFEYKADSDLIKSVKETDGTNKKEALSYLYNSRKINLFFNTAKAATYLTFAAVSLSLVANPAGMVVIPSLVCAYVIFLCVQKGLQMLRAKSYRSNYILFKDNQSPENEFKETKCLIPSKT